MRNTIRKRNDDLLWLDCNEALEQELVRHGYLVFRDVRAGRCRIDRAAVGPNGVFVVVAAGRKNRVDVKTAYDSAGRLWPFYVEHGSIELARKHAKRLSRWLGGGEQGVRVYPLLTLPGWLPNRRGWGDVVLIGAEDYEVLTGSPAIQLPGPLIEKICGRLAQCSGSMEAATRGEGSDNIEGGPFGVEKGASLEIARPRIDRPFLAYTASACRRDLPERH